MDVQEKCRNLYAEVENALISNKIGHARAAVQTAWTILLAHDDSSSVWTTLRLQAVELIARCDVQENLFDVAIERLVEIVPLLETNTDATVQFSVYNTLGTAYWQQGHYATALENLLLALALAYSTDDDAVQGRVEGNVGMLHWFLGDHAKALEHLQRSLAIAERIGHEQGMCLTLMNIGNVYSNIAEYIVALEHYTKALHLIETRQLDAKKTLGSLFMNIAVVFHRIGDYERALDYYTRSLTLREEMGMRADIAVSLANIGVLYLDHAIYDAAEQYLYKAVVLCKELGLMSMEAQFLASLARAKVFLGRAEEAVQCVHQSIAIAKRNGDTRVLGHAYSALGIAHFSSGDYAQALQYLGEARRIHRAMRQITGDIEAKLYMGKVWAEQQQFDRALSSVFAALVLAEYSAEKPMIVRLYDTLTDLYERIGDTEKALKSMKVFHDIEKAVYRQNSNDKMQALQILHRVEEAKKEAEMYRWKNDLLEREMQRLKSDLVTYTVHMAEKTELLQQMKNGVAKVEDGVLRRAEQELWNTTQKIKKLAAKMEAQRVHEQTVQTAQKIQSNLWEVSIATLIPARRELRLLAQRLDDALSDDAVWENFERQFRIAHSTFLEMLAQRNYQLSATEMKVCALLRIGMSSKSISRILNLSSRSVDTYRYNIRQKMGIDPDTNLQQYMAELG